MSDLHLTPVIKVAGTELAAQWLQELITARVDRGLGLVGRTTLRFHDTGFALSTSGVFGIGKEVKVDQPDGGELFVGTVSSVEIELSGLHSVPELVVTVDDKTARLAATTRSRTFLQMTTGAVLDKVAAESGLTVAKVGSLSAVQASQAYLLQTGTDMAFLNALAARAGFVWWCEGSRTLKLAEAGTTDGVKVKLTLGVDIMAFSVRASASGPDKVSVTGWDEGQQASVLADVETKSQATAKKPSRFVSDASGRGSVAARGWRNDLLVADPPPIDNNEATLLAGGMAAEAAAAAVTMTATCLVDSRLKPAVTVEVADVGPASGEYLVSRVEHVYNRHGFTTRVTSGPVRPSGMVDLLGAPTTDPGFSMPGLLTAVVTNADDPDKKGKGRVKVKYPSVSGNVESAWARVLALGGGPKRGMVFQPEVGDEVLIAFERGDTRRPVVLGGLFSDTNDLPTADYVDGNKVKFRRITSRVGHVIEFADGDAPADKHVMIKLGGDKVHKLRMGVDKFEIIVDKVPLTIKNDAGASIEFTAAGDVNITGKNINLKSDGKITVDAKMDATLKGGTKAVVDGATVEVKAKAMGKIEAGGPLSVKGATVAIN